MWVRVTIAALMLLVYSGLASAQEKVALVVGNSTYAHVTQLTNPRNDASDVAQSFERLGFEVTLVNDLGFDAMRKVLRDFSNAAVGADMAVVFFAGHGMEIGNVNYLIPVDARLKTDKDVDFEAVPLDLVMRSVEDAKGLKLVILDACRNNPFSASMKMTSASRSVGRGFARVEPKSGTLVSYAAKGGTTADDGRGRNSPFTKALLEHIEQPGLEINFLFRKIRDQVLRDTSDRQEPFTYGSLTSERIFLKPPVDGVPSDAQNSTPPATPEPPRGQTFNSAASNLCQRARDATLFANNPSSCQRAKRQWEIYKKLYPTGACSSEAELQIAELENNPACGAVEQAPQPPQPPAQNNAAIRMCENARSMTQGAKDCRSFKLAKQEWEIYKGSYPSGSCITEADIRIRYLDLEIGTACRAPQTPQNPPQQNGNNTPNWEHTEPEPEPQPNALANGQYRGVRGYTSRGRPKPFSECLSSYHFNVTVNNGSIRFWSDGRTFRGTIDRSGNVNVTRSGISPRTRTPFNISGHYTNARMWSRYCKSGYFRIFP
ncbi:MAG: caspase domain-containing protein [Pseudomonadota bacterium]